MGRKNLYYALIAIFVCSFVYVSYAGEKVTGSFNVYGTNGINWTGTHNISGQNVNWSDFRVYGSSFGGDHSGINWQSFGV